MSMSSVPPLPRVAILGASSAAGLGVRGNSFAVRLAALVSASAVLQLARSTQTVAEVTEADLDRVRAFAPDLVVLSFGAAEAHLHPGRRLQQLVDRFAPASWRGVAGLEPRPYFSHRITRRLRQRVTSALKVAVKRVGIRLTGGYNRLPTDQFEEHLERLLRRLAHGHRTIVVVGLWSVDDAFFPGTNPLLAANDRVIAAVVGRHPGVVLVRPAGLDRWADFLHDHAHLADSGHDKLAAAVLAALRAGGALAGAPTASTRGNP